MKEVKKIGDVVFKLWVDSATLDEGAISQIKDIAKLPFVKSPVNIMADAHGGYGVPIGTVLKTKGCVIPSAIGNDIGCGMTCFILNISPDKVHWKDTMSTIEETIDLIQWQKDSGLFSNQDYAYTGLNLGVNTTMDGEHIKVADRLQKKSNEHFGTIGGGNHFIEAGETDDGRVYVMVHSGSRGLGSIVAYEYGAFACDINDALMSSNNNRDLSNIPVSGVKVLSDVGLEYLHWVDELTIWANSNRGFIIDTIIKMVFGDVDSSDIASVNCTHNFATYDKEADAVTHYKGANKTTSPVIIAGSCGTKSYIVQHKHNKHGIFCSHGAGRVMSRTQAKAAFTQEEADKTTSHIIQSSNSIDESPLAYKDIDDVMGLQDDLVTKLITLYPKVSVK